MDIAQFIQGVPLWVWILFIFLVRRGIVALSDREMTIRRLFFLPLLFLFWGGYSVINEIAYPDDGLLMMSAGIVVGGILGSLLWRSQPPLKISNRAGYIIRSGTPLTLIMILLAFCLKFTITSMSYMHTPFTETLLFSSIFGFISGAIDGVFWGGTLCLFIPWYKKERKDT